MRYIVENRLGSALIVEDDVDWDVRIKSQLTSFAIGTHTLYNSVFTPAAVSPYGDDWDVLWLGHCMEASQLPEEPAWRANRVILPPDASVPQRHYLKGHDQDLLEPYDNHTRMIHFSAGPVCTYAYALSQKGARKALYELGVRQLEDPFDVALAWWCIDKNDYDIQASCVSPRPPFFHSHVFQGAVGKASDINDNTAPFRSCLDGLCKVECEAQTLSI